MRILDLTRELYNAALQERRDAWRKAGKSVTVYEQMRLLGEVKAVRPEYQGVYAQVLQETLKRLDLGLTHFVATSEGEIVEAPRHFQKAEEKLAKAQRELSRKKKGSNRRKKARLKVAKLHRKIANQRKDFHHKVARKLVNRYGTIVHEDLNALGLARTRLSKGVLDAGWAQFIAILSAKAASAGRRVVAVKPHYTSQICPECGSVRRKELSERVHACECGCVLDRDVAAAKVILALGLDGALGDGQRVAAPA
ncbi:RNA-guided endonuclease InsQ/TnpB family protein [Thermus scotoductus]|uniref:RNA-guided endonuclease InsQ/TnpB family protein n=1 Tax=Thermus scotoductus TaxID=37636 RepID=UPI0020A2AADB|nr:transposase [Thermus scotoductus]